MNQISDFDTSHPVPVVDSARCTRCGLCVKVCPNQALALNGSGDVFVARPDACDYAGLCEMACPERAISRPFVLVWPARRDPREDS